MTSNNIRSRSLHALSVNCRVVIALILRETKTRFGKHKLGYLWAVIEPVSYIVILLLVRTFLSAGSYFDEAIYVFVLTGILIFRLFRAIVGRTMSAISANKALLSYPIVKPNDTIIARIILESITMLIVLAVFFSLLSYFTESTIIHHPSRFFSAIGATLLLAAGIGTFNSVFAVLFPFWERLWGMISLPLLLLSGIFYVPRSLPPGAQSVLQWNPVLNCIEWLRYGTYLSYDPLLSESYVLYIGLLFLAIGLLIERRFRHILVQS